MNSRCIEALLTACKARSCGVISKTPCPAAHSTKGMKLASASEALSRKDNISVSGADSVSSAAVMFAGVTCQRLRPRARQAASRMATKSASYSQFQARQRSYRVMVATCSWTEIGPQGPKRVQGDPPARFPFLFDIDLKSSVAG